jgi:hypothetical protein
VGAFVGLTTRRYPSGEIDYDGHISRRQPSARAPLLSSNRSPHSESVRLRSAPMGASATRAPRLQASRGRGCPQARGHHAHHIEDWRTVPRNDGYGVISSSSASQGATRRPAGT